MAIFGLSRAEEWFYDVTSALKPGEEAYAPDLVSPPKDWFYEKPQWWNEVSQHSITVDEQGRVAGLISNWDTCYLNESSTCITPWPVREDERFVYQGNVAAASGERIPVSILAATKGHHFTDDIKDASLANQGFLDDNYKPLNSSYDIMAHQLMYGRYVNTEEGIAFLGAIFPHVTASMVHRINASAVSGHWIYDVKVDDMIFAGAVFVNHGALPLESHSKLQLRQMAASLRYNHIMADDHACSCKKDAVLAATDPNVQNATGQPEGEKPEITMEDVVSVLEAHTRQIDTLEKVVMELIRESEMEALEEQTDSNPAVGVQTNG